MRPVTIIVTWIRIFVIEVIAEEVIDVSIAIVIDPVPCYLI